MNEDAAALARRYAAEDAARKSRYAAEDAAIERRFRLEVLTVVLNSIWMVAILVIGIAVIAVGAYMMRGEEPKARKKPPAEKIEPGPVVEKPVRKPKPLSIERVPRYSESATTPLVRYAVSLLT